MLVMHEVRRSILESLGVVAAGLVFGLVANGISPRGLSLGRNYFPSVSVRSNTIALPAPLPGTNGTARNRITNEFESANARLAARGWQTISHSNVVELFQSTRYEVGTVIFIDSREDKYYREAHIPGALQFDHYRVEKHLEQVLPYCLGAERIIVYCSGGDCEDSELGAATLTEFGVEKQRIAIYAAGFTEWRRNGMAYEIGSRISGKLMPTRHD